MAAGPDPDPVHRSLVVHLLDHVHDTTEAIGQSLRKESSFAARDADYQDTVLAGIELVITTALRRMTTGQPLVADDLAGARAAFARTAGDGVPLPAMHGALDAIMQVGLAQFWQAAGPRHAAGMVGVTTLSGRNVQLLRSTLAEVYAERHLARGDRSSWSATVASILLDGSNATLAARAAGLALAPAHLVLVHSAHPPPAPPPGCVTVPFRGSPVSLLGATDGEAGDQGLPAVRRWLAAGPPVGAAWARTHADVPAAEDLARSVLRLACAARLAGGLHLPQSTALEAALETAGPAARPLIDILAPLEPRPELLRTLETFLAHDADRTGTAAALFVHRRTLHLRLSRIAALTGHSPTTIRGATVLSAALSARRLAAGAADQE